MGILLGLEYRIQEYTINLHGTELLGEFARTVGPFSGSRASLDPLTSNI